MTFAVSPELQTQVATWRSRATEGTLTLDEMREAIKVLRANRLAAATASAKSIKASKAKTKGPAKSADDMLGELGL